nr:terpene synthase [Ficus pandurata]
MENITTSPSDGNIARKSANYQPSFWHFDFIQSLGSEYGLEEYTRQANDLKEVTRAMLEKVTGALAQLELIDTLQRLGISIHFEDEIKSILKGIHNNGSVGGSWKKNNLYAVSLEFRLLRQHGYCITQEVFNSFKEEMENSKARMIDDDHYYTMGMLNLYEATFHMVKGETTLEEARDLTTKHLKEYVKNKDENDALSTLVSHALEIPLHWTVPILEARWFIDFYERSQNKNHTLLKLSKLNFNILQSTYQEDLKDLSRWWRHIGLAEKLSFFRDRLVENFLWTVAQADKTEFGYYRRMGTKMYMLITIIDDMYDVHGRLEELELFTEVLDRWDVDIAMDQLPNYMKICFLALHNYLSELTYDVLKEQGLYIIKYLKNAWVDLCKHYLLEAKWYASGYKPNLQEYIENAWASISVPVIIVNSYFIITNPITEEALNCFEELPNLFRHSGLICRLANDLGTSSHELQRGDVGKAVQCYMQESGVSEEEAREHINFLIREEWKKMNEEQVAKSPFSETFIDITAVNIARMTFFMYQGRDGFGAQENHTTKDVVFSLIVHPIPL